jgi:hypothetical protein
VELHVLGVAADIGDQEQGALALHAGDANSGMDFQNPTLKSQSLQGVLRRVQRGLPKYVKATLRSLRRYLGEGSPPLQRFAALAADGGVAMGDFGIEWQPGEIQSTPARARRARRAGGSRSR